MNNLRKRKLVSQRHGRRIISNNTNIDIAGCHEHISNEDIVNICSEDSFNVDLYDDSTEDVYNLHGTKKACIEPTILEDQFQCNNIQTNRSDE